MKNNKFKERCKELINDTEFNNKYCVDDIISDNIEILFLLESPHNEEVKCKHPLAGKSGVNMTKIFCKIREHLEPECKGKSIPKCCDKIVPFGKLIKDAHSTEINDKDFIELYDNSDLRNKLRKIGIMNVCNIPMQMQAYCCDDVRKYCEILRILDFLRDQLNFKTRIGQGKDDKNYIQKILKNSLCSKVSRLRKTLFVPMGNLALAYLKQCELSVNSEIFLVNSKPISHPSPRNTEWNKLEKLDFSNGKSNLELLGKELLEIL